jgi:hypothetical protein
VFLFPASDAVLERPLGTGGESIGSPFSRLADGYHCLNQQYFRLWLICPHPVPAEPIQHAIEAKPTLFLNAAEQHVQVRNARERLHRQTLKRKFMTSPSWTTYSLPSARIFPASFAPSSPL